MFRIGNDRQTGQRQPAAYVTALTLLTFFVSFGWITGRASRPSEVPHPKTRGGRLHLRVTASRITRSSRTGRSTGLVDSAIRSGGGSRRGVAEQTARRSDRRRLSRCRPSDRVQKRRPVCDRSCQSAPAHHSVPLIGSRPLRDSTTLGLQAEQTAHGRRHRDRRATIRCGRDRHDPSRHRSRTPARRPSRRTR